MSAPATSLSVVTGDTVHLSGLQDNASAFQDGPQHRRSSCKNIETLIAVGTQSGKVLIFNLLGIAVHEIVMDRPVVSLEWVGDMSAPSILPVPASLSPQPNLVIDMLIDEIGEIEEVSLEHAVEDGRSSIRRERLGRQPQISQPPLSISDIVAEQWPEGTTIVPSQHSLTETSTAVPSHQSPGSNQSIPGTDRAGLLDGQAPRQMLCQQNPTSTGHQSAHFLPPRQSCYMSLGSMSSEEDFFTPPVTRHSSSCQRTLGARVELDIPKMSTSSIRDRQQFPIHIRQHNILTAKNYDDGKRREVVIDRTTECLDSTSTKPSKTVTATRYPCA